MKSADIRKLLDLMELIYPSKKKDLEWKI
jgi:hypothetical protein